MTNIHENAVQWRRIRTSIRRWRIGSKLSQMDVATEMGWSLSKVARLESGDGRPIAADVLALASFYGVPRDETQELVAAARSLPTRIFPNESELLKVFNPHYVNYMEAEQASVRVRQWNAQFIPGLLQTPEYSMEILTKTFKRSRKDAQRVIDARLQRQELLADPGGPDFDFLFDESILLRPVGGPAVMRAQVEKILDVMRRTRTNGKRRVSVGIVPLAVGPTAGMRGPFILLDFDDEEDVATALFIEDPRGDIFSRDRKDEGEIGMYEKIFGELEQVSLTGDEFTRRTDELMKLLEQL